jgi:hypothetical protein
VAITLLIAIYSPSLHQKNCQGHFYTGTLKVNIK